MKKLVMMLVCLFCMQGIMKAEDKPIDVNELPAMAQQFIKKHFPKSEVLGVTKDNNVLKKDYEVAFTDGTKIDFDKNGNWVKVDGKKKTLPSAIIPAQITKFVSAKFPKASIVEIEKEGKGYDVKISTGTELKFDKNFKLIEADY